MLKQILSCDWGTTSFRLRLVDVVNATVVAERKSAKGIAQAHEEWLQCGLPEDDRISFYMRIIEEQVSGFGADLNKVPLLISGMASSSIGMRQLPYASIPFTINATALAYKEFDLNQRNVFVFSGVSSGDDVMRGEETILLGCDIDAAGCIVILPGTHSKHAYIKEGVMHAIKTYMTGEIFDLLITKSILSKSVVKPARPTFGRADFIKGLNKAVQGNVLNAAFHARTNSLLKNQSPESNYYFLSGVLIGTELKDLPHPYKHVCLATNDALKRFYETALAILHPAKHVVHQNADDAFIKGHVKIAKQLINTI